MHALIEGTTAFDALLQEAVCIAGTLLAAVGRLAAVVVHAMMQELGGSLAACLFVVSFLDAGAVHLPRVVGAAFLAGRRFGADFVEALLEMRPGALIAQLCRVAFLYALIMEAVRHACATLFAVRVIGAMCVDTPVEGGPGPLGTLVRVSARLYALVQHLVGGMRAAVLTGDRVVAVLGDAGASELAGTFGTDLLVNPLG